MQRTRIEVAPDGHILLTLESTHRPGGNSHQRRIERKREINGQAPLVWHRRERIILRKPVLEEIPVKFVASKASITLLPLNSPDIKEQAWTNDHNTEYYVERAEDAVQAITEYSAQFEVKPPKRMRVVIVEEE